VAGYSTSTPAGRCCLCSHTPDDGRRVGPGMVSCFWNPVGPSPVPCLSCVQLLRGSGFGLASVVVVTMVSLAGALVCVLRARRHCFSFCTCPCRACRTCGAGRTCPSRCGVSCRAGCASLLAEESDLSCGPGGDPCESPDAWGHAAGFPCPCLIHPHHPHSMKGSRRSGCWIPSSPAVVPLASFCLQG
jgi:hypothetical protein